MKATPTSRPLEQHRLLSGLLSLAAALCAPSRRHGAHGRSARPDLLPTHSPSAVACSRPTMTSDFPPVKFQELVVVWRGGRQRCLARLVPSRWDQDSHTIRSLGSRNVLIPAPAATQTAPLVICPSTASSTVSVSVHAPLCTLLHLLAPADKDARDGVGVVVFIWRPRQWGSA